MLDVNGAIKANGGAYFNGNLEANGNISGQTITGTSIVGPLSGNATTATTLQNARLINGVSFNGSANITVADSTKLPLTGGTLTGGLNMGSNGTYSHELKFVNNTWTAGIDYQNNGKLRLIDRSGGRESINFYLLNGDIEANNTSNVVTNAFRTSGNSFINGGNLGIGTTNPSYKLDVSGAIRATGDVIAYSDARVKDNVITIDKALEKVAKLRGVSYTRNDVEDKTTKIGVIAQEVLEVLPEVVQQDDKGKYSVAYGNMVGLLIEAIKELKAEVDELKSRL